MSLHARMKAPHALQHCPHYNDIPEKNVARGKSNKTEPEVKRTPEGLKICSTATFVKERALQSGAKEMKKRIWHSSPYGSIDKPGSFSSISSLLEKLDRLLASVNLLKIGYLPQLFIHHQPQRNLASAVYLKLSEVSMKLEDKNISSQTTIKMELEKIKF